MKTPLIAHGGVHKVVVDAGYVTLCSCETEEIMNNIVRCVNAHDGLVRALKCIANDYGNSTKPIRCVAIDALRAAGIEV